MSVIIVEHKTTLADISPGSPYWRRLTLDSQISTYHVGARALGYEPDGVMYDVIRKPGIRPLEATPPEKREYTKPRTKKCPECKKKSAGPAPHVVETEAGSVECVDGEVLTYRGGELYKNQREADEAPHEFAARLRADIAENPDTYFQRATIVRLDDEEREAAFDAWAVTRQIRESQLANRWPRNDDACDSYGSLCSYFDVCSGAASIDDPTRFRDAEAHEELTAQGPDPSIVGHTTDGQPVYGSAKRRLPLVSSSSLKAYRSCPRKYFYAYERRRRSLFVSDALRFGTLIHRGLEVWWKTVDVDAAVAAMAGEADPFERAKAEELMRAYHLRWRSEPLQVLGVEVEFRAPLVNPETGAASRTWERAGKIDALVAA